MKRKSRSLKKKSENCDAEILQRHWKKIEKKIRYIAGAGDTNASLHEI